MKPAEEQGKIRPAVKSSPQLSPVSVDAFPLACHPAKLAARPPESTDPCPMTDDASPPTGYDVIQGYLKPDRRQLPGSTGCSNAQAPRAVCRQGAQPEGAGDELCPPRDHSPRIARMIHETASMMFLTTRTETEALLLEQNLIKQLKPRYNVLAARRQERSRTSWSATNTPFPRSRSIAGEEVRKGQLFRPLRQSAGAVNRTLNQLQKVVRPAQLLRPDVPKPHPALSAVSDQALLRPPASGWRPSRATPSAWPSRRSSCKASTTALQEALAAQMATASEADGVRTRRRAARPHPRHDPGADRAGHQPQGRGRG